MRKKCVPIEDIGSERINHGIYDSKRTYIEQTETRTGRRVSNSPRGRKPFLFFFFYDEFVHTPYQTHMFALRERHWSFDRWTRVLSTRSRVEIDKRHMRTSVTYLTGALDSFGVEKSLRFPARYQLSRSVVSLSLHPLSLSLLPFFSSPFLITD